METVSRPRCRTGVEEKLEYSISTLLWNDPESYAENGSKVAKGFTDCTQRRLPAPFFEVTKLIVDCEAEPVQGDRCLPPANYTDVTLRNVALWIGQLRQKAGDPVLLQIHEHLRDSLEFLPRRPILFLGEVSGWKRLIAFCYQPNDECYGGDETLGIIDDSDEIFRAIQGLISKVN
jgi:hypothetical protein